MSALQKQIESDSLPVTGNEILDPTHPKGVITAGFIFQARLIMTSISAQSSQVPGGRYFTNFL